MEPFFLRLAVAVIPLVLLVTLVIVLDALGKVSTFSVRGKAAVTPFSAPSSWPPRYAGSRRQNSRQTEDV